MRARKGPSGAQSTRKETGNPGLTHALWGFLQPDSDSNAAKRALARAFQQNSRRRAHSQLAVFPQALFPHAGLDGLRLLYDSCSSFVSRRLSRRASSPRPGPRSSSLTSPCRPHRALPAPSRSSSSGPFARVPVPVRPFASPRCFHRPLVCTPPPSLDFERRAPRFARRPQAVPVVRIWFRWVSRCAPAHGEYVMRATRSVSRLSGKC